MKKNTMMRAATLLLVLTLMTSCFVGGTFAKYTTGKEADDTARVAHWGVEVAVSGDEAFKTEYEGTASTDNTDKFTVKSSSSTAQKVVAPGTDGTLATIDVTGSPEVDAEVKVVADITISTWLIDADDDGDEDDYYCPLVVTVGSNTIVGNTYESAALFAEAIEEAINGYSKYYNAHSDTALAIDVDITWKWDISTNTVDTEQTDKLDTILGDKAATLGDAADYISLDLSVTVEQVD